MHVNPHTIASLRLTLRNLEQSSEPGRAPADLDGIRRILLSRITELEGAQTVDVPATDPATSQKEPDQL